MNRLQITVCLLLSLSVFVDSGFWPEYSDEDEELLFEDEDVQVTESPEIVEYFSEDDVNENTVPTVSDPDYTRDESNSIYGIHDSVDTIINRHEDTTQSSIPAEETVETPVNPEVIHNINVKVEGLMEEVKKQQNQLAELININTRLINKIDLIEQQTKTNSLIFFNVPEKENEFHKTTLNKVLYVLNKVMKLKIRAAEIAVALRADSEGGTTSRPILVRFTNFVTKMQVLAAKPRLQRSQVVIEADYSEGVARTRAQLVPYLDAAKARGLHAFILYDRLVVDGVKLTLQELQASDQYRTEVEDETPVAK